ncbi:phenylalanine--tRNA ligase subunit beta [Stomatohabitans albus]|uniref:phenylalanine--tRNA ligase subunit beta n=1 Tax=Stomatohabitans albus TaxID=3110766 RepID=UPI00300C3FBD
MKVCISWLREYVDTDLSAHAIADIFTLLGFEVERVWQPLAEVEGVVAVQVEEKTPVEGSNKLNMCKVFDGTNHHMIICGASNYDVGAVVPGALPGAVLPGGFTIGRRKMMGLVSNGMLASAKELGIGDDSAGIWVLGDHAPALGTNIAQWLGLDEWVLDIDITPHSGHAATIWGLARELAAKTGAPLKAPLSSHQVPEPVTPIEGLPKVVIEEPSECRRFDGRLITDLTVQPSPPQVQVRLALSGFRPINAVVDATNYAMLETGHPTHAFDASTVHGDIRVRNANEHETLLTLDDTERTLVPDDVVIADDAGAIAIAGVMGGARTEVTEETTTVYLETAAWDPRRVLRTARRHQLFSEARARFERRVSAETVPLGAQRVTDLLHAWSGGTVVGGADYYPIPDQPVTITIDPAYVRRLIGVPIENAEQIRILHALECRVDTCDEGLLAVVPPPWRPDLTIAADLVEEIARVYGYDQIEPRVPATGKPGRRGPDHQAELAIRERLAGAGWTEVLSYPFTSMKALEQLGLDANDSRLDPVRLVNPLSRDEEVLRTTMVCGLAEVLAKNVNRGAPQVAVFEIGHVFIRPTAMEPAFDGGPTGVTLPAEPHMVALAACGLFGPARHGEPTHQADVYDLTGALATMIDGLGFDPNVLTLSPTSEMPYHPGRAAVITGPAGEYLGTLGEWHPRVLKAFNLPARSIFAEIRLDRLIALDAPRRQATIPSPLPGLRFDVAVVTDRDEPYRKVYDVVRAAAGDRLTNIGLFDVYEGSSLGEGKRSLAFNVALDDATTQLTDNEEAAAIAAIRDAVNEQGWEFRGR